MRIVCISPWYSEGMGYTENMLPKALAAQGHDVHLVTSTAQINYYSPNYEKTYQSFLGPKFKEPGVQHIDGYTLHRLPYYETKKQYEGPGITGLYEYLQHLQPDVLQSLEILLDCSYDTARYARDNRRPYFTECHIHASIFRVAGKKTWKEYVKNWRNSFYPKLRFINATSHICYAIAEDVAEIAASHYHVPAARLRIQSLGVDTDTYTPTATPQQQQEREEVRKSFGFRPDDIVCIYTGRFTSDKNPHCLAKAVDTLNKEGLPFKALFVGNGPELDVSFLQSMQGCQVSPFVPARELPRYYRSADIGVWPREESTSQLDAAACGLPLILSRRIKVVERVDGNGLLYTEGDHLDLARALKELQDPGKRNDMSAIGVRKVRDHFSWEKIARERIQDYIPFIPSAIK